MYVDSSFSCYLRTAGDADRLIAVENIEIIIAGVGIEFKIQYEILASYVV